MTRIHASFMAALLVSFPAVAHADVLEIDGESHGWIAGGPSQPKPLAADPQAPGLASLPDTDVGDTAGPLRWQGRVTELSAKYDLSPMLIEALVWQESRWNENAVSPVGARGLAQLMPGTARQLGVNSADPSANLEGGARYLREQLDRFNMTLPDAQIQLFRALRAAGAGAGSKPLVVVLVHGGALAIAEVKAGSSAIIDALYPGVTGGSAVADAIFGLFSPVRTQTTYTNLTRKQTPPPSRSPTSNPLPNVLGPLLPPPAGREAALHSLRR